jgi:hypothetical protein
MEQNGHKLVLVVPGRVANYHTHIVDVREPWFVRGSLFLDVELQWIHHTTWHTTSTAGHAVVNIMTNIIISVSMLMYIDVLGAKTIKSPNER